MSQGMRAPRSRFDGELVTLILLTLSAVVLTVGLAIHWIGVLL